MGPSGSILVIDDNREFATVLSRELRRRGCEVATAFTGAEGLALVDAHEPALVFLDVRLPDISGTDVLARLRAAHPGIEVVIMTGYPELASAMAAIRGRVADYLCKPFAFGDLDRLLARVLPAAGPPARRRERASSGRAGLPVQLLGAAPATARLRDLVEQLARSGVRAALVTGESGTGKELVARMLHALGPRAAGPFVAVNCSAVGETLFESEFFGHERGAFTGAVGARRGLVELAHRGTLFLDEVGDMPRACQAKLLRFLDDQHFRRVGSERTIQVDVQVIAATNRDLQAMVAAGEFREDLYFRLAVAPVPVAPLRDRPEDVPVLARHFLAEASRRAGKTVRDLNPAAEAVLVAYPWPGNVRELRNLVERLVILCAGDEISESDLPEEYRAAARARLGLSPRAGAPPVGPGDDGPRDVPLSSLEDMERSYIRRVLGLVAGNKTRAAEILGISRQTLRTKLGSPG